MPLRTPTLLLTGILLAALLHAAPAHAAKCGGDFNSFISEFSREAQAAGISGQTVSSA